jgi:hypothetical protein
MKPLLPYVLMLAAAWTAEAETFEAPAVQIGSSLPASWQGSAEITAEESLSGTQSLKVAPDAKAQYLGTLPAGITFIDLQILPVTGSTEILNLAGARLGFDADGKIRLFSGEDTQGRTAQNVSYEVTAGAAAGWVRITVRVDSAKQLWDLYVDGKPAEANLPLGASTAALTIQSPAAGATYLDDFTLGEENPLFPDADRDGLADAEEKANGLNPYGDDRDGDLDGDGVSNVDEFFAGTSPKAPGALDGQTTLIYVDNLHGNDAFTGQHSYPSIGQTGPKASLKAAMAAAPSGATIIVLKGTGLYDEGSRGIPGKHLTIKPVDSIAIR